MTQTQGKRDRRTAGVRFTQKGIRGFTIVELLIVVLVGSLLTAISVPLYKSAMISMQLNSTVSAISGAISQTRYAAIMNGHVYTLVLTTPGNTYVVSDVTEGTSNAAVPLPTTAILINGGTSATYTYTLCPNGTAYGTGGTCIGNNTVPPALSATNNGRQVNINVSGVGSVISTRIQ
jgi:prepilin-type N-terminal cleavage/methylation domain-containing protein